MAAAQWSPEKNILSVQVKFSIFAGYAHDGTIWGGGIIKYVYHCAIVLIV